MTSIITKYIGPTNTKGSRIKASAGKGREITISYPYHVNGIPESHDEAMRALCHKMGWSAKKGMIRGATETGYVYVFADGDKVEL